MFLGDDEFIAYYYYYNDIVPLVPRGRQVFKYVGNDGNDIIFGFDPSLDIIQLPPGQDFQIRSQNLDTIVEFGNDRVVLAKCACENDVVVVNDEVQTDPPAAPANELSTEVVVGVSVGIPILFVAIAFFVVFLNRKKNGPAIAPTQPQSLDSNKTFRLTDRISERSRGMSNWFYIMYGYTMRRGSRDTLATDDSDRSAKGHTFTNKGLKPYQEAGRSAPPGSRLEQLEDYL